GLNDVTLVPCGLTPLNTWAIVPSLPEASVPCRTSSNERLASAQRRVCGWASAGTGSTRAASAALRPPLRARVAAGSMVEISTFDPGFTDHTPRIDEQL